MAFHVRGNLIQMADSQALRDEFKLALFPPPDAIHTPSMSSHRPVTPEDIADVAIGAAEAGAAIMHPSAKINFWKRNDSGASEGSAPPE